MQLLTYLEPVEFKKLEFPLAEVVVVVGFEVVVNALVKVAGAANNQVNSLSHRFHDIGVH